MLIAIFFFFISKHHTSVLNAQYKWNAKQCVDGIINFLVQKFAVLLVYIWKISPSPPDPPEKPVNDFSAFSVRPSKQKRGCYSPLKHLFLWHYEFKWRFWRGHRTHTNQSKAIILWFLWIQSRTDIYKYELGFTKTAAFNFDWVETEHEMKWIVGVFNFFFLHGWVRKPLLIA